MEYVYQYKSLSKCFFYFYFKILHNYLLKLIFLCDRSELGKISLDKVFRERENLNFAIVESLNKASASWGLVCFRYEIRKIFMFSILIFFFI